MKNKLIRGFIAISILAGISSCKKNISDSELQNSATTIVTSLPDVSVKVEKGVAHLSGTFKDEASKDQIIAQLKAIPGIKDVHDMAVIKPVAQTIALNSPLSEDIRQKVSDAIKDIPTVKMEIINNELTITGNATKEQARMIKESVDGLKIGKVNYNYIVK